jgi:hypothetical protein
MGTPTRSPGIEKLTVFTNANRSSMNANRSPGKREPIARELLSPQNREILWRALDLYYEREYFAKEILPFISLSPARVPLESKAMRPLPSPRAT